MGNFTSKNLCYRRKRPNIYPFARMIFDNGIIINFIKGELNLQMSIGLLSLNDSIRQEHIFTKKELQVFKAYQKFMNQDKKIIYFYSSIPDDEIIINQAMIIYETIIYASKEEQTSGKYLQFAFENWQMFRSPDDIKKASLITVKCAIKQIIRECVFTPKYIISPTKLLLLYALLESKNTFDDKVFFKVCDFIPPCKTFLILLCEFICEYDLGSKSYSDKFYDEVKLAYQLILSTESIRSCIPRTLLEKIILNNHKYSFDDLINNDIYYVISKFCRETPRPLFLYSFIY